VAILLLKQSPEYRVLILETFYLGCEIVNIGTTTMFCDLDTPQAQASFSLTDQSIASQSFSHWVCSVASPSGSGSALSNRLALAAFSGGLLVNLAPELPTPSVQ